MCIVVGTGVKHPHFHISQIDIGIFDLTVTIFALMRTSWRRVTIVIAFDLLLHVFLADQVLVSCRVIVIWEELGQKETHVLARLWSRPIVILSANIATIAKLLMRACTLKVGKIAPIFHMRSPTSSMLHASTLLVN